jgi:hypothetical protein
MMLVGRVAVECVAGARRLSSQNKREGGANSREMCYHVHSFAGWDAGRSVILCSRQLIQILTEMQALS